MLDETLLANIQAISQQINLAISYLSPSAEADEKACSVAYARYVASVFALCVTTLPTVTKYHLYELLDLGISLARQAAESESLN